jgi:site-specific DNA-methyltransferase (adenine-specific)
MNYEITNTDCITGSLNIKDNSIDLIICDPPFGINESKFDNLYNRNNNNILEGYIEAPSDYDKFTLDWLTQATRILKDNGSMYIVSGWSNLSSFYKAIEKLGLIEINHIIWKYNFGVNTSKKYVSSHYHIFYLSKSNKRTFNTNCRYTQMDKENNKSLLYQDLEDVWIINKEYRPGEIKNINKLPNKLVEKMITYSSNPGDVVCDFFMGNFTTANCSLRLGRKVKGFELNKESYNYFIKNLDEIEFGCDIIDNNKENPYFNQGKPLLDTEILKIINRYDEMYIQYKNKKSTIEALTKEFGRGRFSIKNILDKNKFK